MKNIFSSEIITSLKENGILPVVCLTAQNELDTFIQALIKTPIRCIEITLRHPFSLGAISFIKNNYPQFFVGAGTVINKDLFDCAVESGADFCVSPGYDREIIDEAFNRNIPYLPGCSTPSEIQQAIKSGLATLKYFPAECSGGINALKLYQGAFADATFIPTGGINQNNYLQYLRCENVLACGGSFMLPKEMLVLGNTEGIYNVLLGYLNAIKEVRK